MICYFQCNTKADVIPCQVPGYYVVVIHIGDLSDRTSKADNYSVTIINRWDIRIKNVLMDNITRRARGVEGTE
jgi:hypothetical protein